MIYLLEQQADLVLKANYGKIGIYAESFSQDPEFYEFTRSMKAYVETFESKSDVMLIDSESEFFKYLNDKKDEN